jgi:FkbM family methyltransferase
MNMYFYGLKPSQFLTSMYQDRAAVIVDVGARGGFHLLPVLHEFAEVHMVEPDPASAALLKKATFRFRKSHIHELAISSVNGRAELNITEHGSMSSLLEPEQTEFNRGFGEMKNAKDWAKGMNVAMKVEVKTAALTDFTEDIQAGFIDFLKLDTQGNEFQILNSAQDLLKSGRVGVICCEVAYFPIYKGQGYFSEIDLLLRSCGFRFVECRSYPDVLDREDEFSAGSKLHERPKKAPVGDAWYVFNWDNENDAVADQRKRCAVILACEGYFSEAKYLLKNILNEQEQNDLFRFCSAYTREPAFRHFLRRWTPPAIQQWRAKRKR